MIGKAIRFVARIFGFSQTTHREDDVERADQSVIADAIKRRAITFRGKKGMALVIQEGYRITLYFVDGLSRCSWSYTNQSLAMDLAGNALLDREPMSYVLSRNQDSGFHKFLKRVFADQEVTVSPLWKLNKEAWDYKVQEALHRHDVAIRISFY